MSLLSFLILLCAFALSPAQADRFGREHRITLDAMEYPWSTIGRLNAAGRAHCTAFLVGPRSALTAAHCLYEFKSGRWLHPKELFFLPGFQRDQYILKSPIKSFVISRSYQPELQAGEETTRTDWALLTLEKPIGQDAGWLPMLSLGSRQVEKIKAGKARLMVSGYRAGAPYAQSLAANCDIPRYFKTGGIAHFCYLQKGDSGSPLLYLQDGTVSAIGINVIGIQPERSKPQNIVAGALPLTLLSPEQGRTSYLQQINADPDSPSVAKLWSSGQKPASSSPVALEPYQSLAFMLKKLGHLDTKSVRAFSASRQSVTDGLKSFYARKTSRPASKALEDVIKAFPPTLSAEDFMN
ncbi:trypsin-like serine peptidase [Kiloniella sp. b19]|uniref:trypsin-like serine peptidase n=1 Tax=Kiloniella sp. GXU_MW_B19 TaxID=3141326 RepID=UPI0031DE1E48